LSNSERVGIDRDNVFVFARSAGINSVDACDCIRRVVSNAGVQKPELIRSTKLRKYVATVSQLLDMTENELDLLCRHMGHSVNVHHSFYRLPSQTLELAKISKLLLAVETGKLSNLSGKKFEELDTEEIADVEDEVESDADVDSAVPSLSLPLESCATAAQASGGSEVPETTQSVNEAESNVDVDSAVPSLLLPLEACPTAAQASGGSEVPEMTQSVNKSYRRKKVSRGAQKRPWTSDEKDAVFHSLSEYIKKGIVPGKKPCTEAIEKSGGVLRNRTWEHVKFAVKNILVSSKRHLQ